MKQLNQENPRQEAELAIIGCLLEKPDLSVELKVEWFDDIRIADIYNRIKKLAGNGKSIDWGLVWQDKPDDEHMGLLQAAINADYSTENFPRWRDKLIEFAQKTKTNHAILEIAGSHGEPDFSIQKAVQKLESAVVVSESQRNNSYGPDRISQSLINHMEAKFNLNGKMSGLETGFTDLDKFTDGLQLGESSILAARPSAGKTALACNLTDHICLVNKIPTLFISLEMAADALSRRMLSANQRIDMRSLRTGNLTDKDFSKLAVFNKLLKNSPLFIEEGLSGMSASRAAALIRQHATRNGVKFVVIDYLQKLKADTKNEKRTYEVAETSGIITGAAKESGVALLCLAQLNREGEKSKGKDDKARRPRLSDLSDSGQIERDADNVFLIHPCSDFTEIVIGKQRDGETGIVRLHFEGWNCRFTNLRFPDSQTNLASNDP